MNDLVGLGWRPELAAGILANLSSIDIVEVIADDYFDAPRKARRALTTLAAQVPVTLHGISLGLASCTPVETKRLDNMARLINEIAPEYWSEHLAFVRGGGIEIGHLTAPPRTLETIDATLKNIAAATRIVGTAPQAENIATLIEPPGSKLDEPSWLADTIRASNCDLLLDLHNVYANSLNFGYDPIEFIRALPIHKIASIHLAGGKLVGPPGEERLLDDHLHDVPDPVYGLLEEVASLTHRPLNVILERDGDYPSMEHLLIQLQRARTALAKGCNRRKASVDSSHEC